MVLSTHRTKGRHKNKEEHNTTQTRGGGNQAAPPLRGTPPHPKEAKESNTKKEGKTATPSKEGTTEKPKGNKTEKQNDKEKNKERKKKQIAQELAKRFRFLVLDFFNFKFMFFGSFLRFFVSHFSQRAHCLRALSKGFGLLQD